MALAIAVTTSQLGTAQTLIFDEVDSGVGGAVAETVGRLMKQLGTRPPGAGRDPPAPGGRLRRPPSGGVQTAARQGDAQQRRHAVQGEQRVGEIARMLGGEKLSSTTLAHAKEMLQSVV